MELRDIFDFLLRIGFSQSKWKKELAQLRQEVSELKQKLIPFEAEEIALLSLMQSNTKAKKGVTKMYKGILETIYYEALFSYVIKVFRKDYQLTLVNSSVHEFIFLKKGASKQVYLKESLVGYLNMDGTFVNDKNKMLGYIDKQANFEMCPVWIMDKNVGFVANPKTKRLTTTRASSLFKELDEKEQIIFLCMMLNFITEEIIP